MLQHRKRELTAECPASPAPSMISESSVSSEEESASPRKRQKFIIKRVTFDFSNSDESSATSLETTTTNTYDKYDAEARSSMWWSQYDLKRIMRREGRFVLDLKISTNKNIRPLSCTLKKTINETFKNCVDAPVALKQDAPIVLTLKDPSFEPSSSSSTTISSSLPAKEEALTTTRGLERYVAPIMSAHRQMVVQSLLTTQRQLIYHDVDSRTTILGERYEHMSKVAAHFAIVMGRCDAATAALW